MVTMMTAAIQENFHMNILLLLPAVAVIVMAVCKCPSIPTLMVSTLVAVVLAMLVQADKDFRELFYTNRNHSIFGGNTAYYFNPQDVSAYCSANFSVTKEIGKWVSLSFYATHFINLLYKFSVALHQPRVQAV